MIKPLEKGDIAISMAGHDTERLYVVTKIEPQGFVWVVDGEYRPSKNPKRKRASHLKFVAKSGLNINKLNDEQLNTGVKKLLKEIKKEVETNAQRR